jgi:hypothetical protein
MLRRLRLEDEQGRVLARRRVQVYGRGGSEYVDDWTDSIGVLSFDFEADEIDRVELDGIVIARDLSLLYLGSEELRVTSRVEADLGHQYRMTLVYPDRTPVAKKAVWLYDRFDKVQRYESDDWGRVDFAWPDDYIERIEVDQRPIERMYSLIAVFGNKYEFELQVPHLTGGSEAERSDLRHRLGMDYTIGGGFRGRLYYQDGTQVQEGFTVQASFAGSSATLSTNDAASYCHDDGEFFIATPPHVGGQRPLRVWVNQQEVQPSDYTRDDESGFYIVLVPRGFLGQAGSGRGGVIAGLVLDQFGTIIRGARIDVEIMGSGFASGDLSGKTHSNEQGQFILMFTGGVRLKRLYVDGQLPKRIYQKHGEEELPLSVEQLRPGTFGLFLETG